MFDTVITTAVLEHVVAPEVVVSEIRRVLCEGGMVYSELPFLQDVHEGAYDFSRYTLGGHRLLFKAFSEADYGLVAGPATSLSWSLENFILLLMPLRALRQIAKLGYRLAFFWLPQIDRLIRHLPGALDSAACTYYVGHASTNNTRSGSPERRVVETYKS